MKPLNTRNVATQSFTNGLNFSVIRKPRKKSARLAASALPVRGRSAAWARTSAAATALNRSLSRSAGRMPTAATTTPMMIARPAAPSIMSSKSRSLCMISRNHGAMT